MQSLLEVFENHSFVFVVSMGLDKDYLGFMKAAARAEPAAVVCFSPAAEARAAPSGAISNAARDAGLPTIMATSFEHAVEEAKEARRKIREAEGEGKAATVVFTGSFRTVVALLEKKL